jgi:hypothetical protein
VAGFVLGSTATEVIHKAPCSVLVARRSEGDEFPNKIVVGVDGSPESAAAYVVARRLYDRFGAELLPVVAHGGEAVDRSLIDSIVARRREDVPEEPVDALVAATAGADLLVVGSRSLHGLRALDPYPSGSLFRLVRPCWSCAGRADSPLVRNRVGRINPMSPCPR